MSNSTPHQVVVASPFQLGWKAVAWRSKQLPQGELGGAAPALLEGEPTSVGVELDEEPDEESVDEPEEDAVDEPAEEPDEEPEEPLPLCC